MTETETARLRPPGHTPVPLTSDPKALIGEQLDRYVLKEVVGMGGVGVVYAAYDPDLDRRVALKLLRTDRHISIQARQRLLREARAMAKLSHPNVISVLEIGSAGSHDFVVMELIQGVSLADWLQGAELSRPQMSSASGSAQSRPAAHAKTAADALAATMNAEEAPPSQANAGTAQTPATPSARPWREVLDLFVRAGRGLAAAHEAGIIHRDFKAANVLLGKDGRVLVTDFGLARLSGDRLHDADAEIDAPAPLTGVAITQTGLVMGTPAYMAPEQFRAGPTDARTDQFNFCASLFHALYGERPFAGKDLAALKASVLEGRPPAAPAGSPVPRRLYQVLVRGLAADPSSRYASMNELLHELAQVADRRPKQILAAAAALLLMAGLAVAFAMVGRDQPAATGPASIELPADPAVRAKVQALYTELAAIDKARRQGERKNTSERAQAALKDARATEFRPLVVEALLLVLKTMRSEERKIQGQRLADEAVILSEELDDSRLRALALNELALLQFLERKDLDTNRRAVARARAAAESHPSDIRVQFAATLNEAMLAMLENKLKDAEERFFRARELAAQEGEVTHVVEATLLLAAVTLPLDRERARTYIRDGVARARAFIDTAKEPDVWQERWFPTWADHLEAVGDFAEARALRSALVASRPSDTSTPKPAAGRIISGRVIGAGDDQVSVELGSSIFRVPSFMPLARLLAGARVITADRTGHFTFEDVPDEVLVLAAYSQRGHSRFLRIEPDGDHRNIELTLRPLATLRGAIALGIPASEPPILNLQVAAEELLGLAAVGLQVDTDGRFAATDVPIGHYQVAMTTPEAKAVETIGLGTIEVTEQGQGEVTFSASQGPSALAVEVTSPLYGSKPHPVWLYLGGSGLPNRVTYAALIAGMFRNPAGFRHVFLLDSLVGEPAPADAAAARVYRFRGLAPGAMTLCALELTNIERADLAQILPAWLKNADRIELACMPVTIPPSGEAKVTIESAPLPRLVP